MSSRKKIFFLFLILAVFTIIAFGQKIFLARAASPNGSACSNNAQCSSGHCAENTVCCASDQCGWGAENGNPIMCIANGGTKSNQWLTGICRSGSWKTALGGYGCSNVNWPCDNGSCNTSQNNGQGGNGKCVLPIGGSTCYGGSDCSSGVCNCGFCVPASGDCGSGFSPHYASNGDKVNQTYNGGNFNGICTNGSWYIAADGYGCSLSNPLCSPAQFNCVSGSTCDKNATNGHCSSALLPNGSNCTSDSECQSNFCWTKDGNRTCMSCDHTASTPNGGFCNCGFSCQSNNCRNFICVAQCTDSCIANAKKCSGNGVQTCSDTNNDSCLEWGDAVACGTGQTCSNGACVCSPNCSGKSCGSDGCGGVCGTLGGACPTGQNCDSSGQCANNGCAPKTCLALNYPCGSVDNGCGGTLTNCSTCQTGYNCQDHQCVASSSGCVARSSQKCDTGNLYWYDSCGNKGDLSQNCGTNTVTNNFRCSDSWLQQATTTKDCVNGACVQNQSWNNIQDCSKTGKVCAGNACVSGDVTPPSISGTAPSGVIYYANTTLTANTDEPADCRYSTIDKTFDLMTSNFASTDKRYHSAAVALGSVGTYTYFVRCRDVAGNANLSSARITFHYVTLAAPTQQPKDNPEVKAPADTTPPVISDLAPSGDVSTGSVMISCSTDEKATCKYDIVDADYGSLANTMDVANDGTSQSAQLTLSSPGNYNYYIRCEDVSGNKNTGSAQVSFIYAQPSTVAPVISGLQPTGAVYQKNVALMVYTDKVSDCRWSANDDDFDNMGGLFSTADGQTQQANVDLNDFGQFNYYVRCKDKNGNKDVVSSVINFEYQNPDHGTGSTVQSPAEAACDNPTAGDSDGTCNPASDCVCDPDCPAAPDAGADPDCAAAESQTQPAGNIGLIVMSVIGLLFVVITIIVVFLIKKNKSGADEPGEDVSDEDISNEDISDEDVAE